MMKPEDAMSARTITPAVETPQQILAAYFEECARMLRKHPELFEKSALEHVGVVAGLSTRVVRLAARGAPLTSIVRDVGSLLFEGVAQVAGAGVRASGPRERIVLLLLAGARRGWVKAGEQAMADEARRHPLMTAEIGADGAFIVSGCLRCGKLERRPVEAPSPCEACGFVFKSVYDDEGASDERREPVDG
jgi:hypothetical protein